MYQSICIMSWIQTAHNKKLDYLHPSTDQILIEDIATGLSSMPRFAGQLKNWYSVAEHCILAERLYFQGTPRPKTNTALAILMHDASEAYMCDVPTPLKKLLPEYQKIESRLMQVIKSKFLINGGQETEDVVAYYDILMLKNEALHERGKLHWLSNAKYKDIPEIDNFMIYHLRPEDAKLIFLQRFNQLYNEVSDKV